MAVLAARAAAKVVGEGAVVTSLPTPNMGGEDFAYFLTEKKGAYMFLSSSNPEKGTNVPHHNAKFDVDEDVLHLGTEIFVSIVNDYLEAK